MEIIKKIIAFIRKDFTTLTVATTVPSLLIDLLFIVINGFTAAILRSPWYLAMCLYYIMLTIMRFSLLLGTGMKAISRNKEKTDIKNYLMAHRMLIVMDIILGIAIIFLVFHHIVRDFPGALIFFVAFYTIYKVTLSLINLSKAHKTNSLTTITLRKIGNVDALVSLLILESALMNRFGDRWSTYAFMTNLFCGLAVWAIILGMAVWGLHKAKRLKKELQ
ncbi:MAG: hypothetical protein II718_09130 [Clostridiales bacterium]|nr:hypothetical protein [Clostridiales bacterium]